jgi:hypothetical protein
MGNEKKRNKTGETEGSATAKNFRLGPGQIEVVDDITAEILRHKTPAERLAIAFNLWTSTRDMLRAHLKRTHPEWDDEMVNREVAKRLLHGDVLTTPEKHGGV